MADARTEERVRPSDDAIVLSMLAAGRDWYGADEVRGLLARLGFKLRTQQVAAWLGRLSREECPMVERRLQAHLGFRDHDYGVTRFGRCQIGNHFPGFRTYEPAPEDPS